MKLRSRIKIGYGRCEKPENTVKRLESAIGSLYEHRYVEEKVSDRLYWAALYIDDLGFRSMGKGISSALCKAGALAEGAEWLSARETHVRPGYVATHQQNLKNAVRIEDLLSHVSTVTPSVIERIKNADCAHYWVDGHSLADGRVRKVPVEFIRNISGPSGLAAGNFIEEAIVHGTNEVFERRAHITVLRNKMVVPTIDPKTIKHPVIREQMDFVRGKGIKFWLKDLSFDGELPCVGAYFFDPNIPEEFQFHHFFKVGSSFNREDALIRTFTEYAQGRRLDEFIKGGKAEQARVLEHDCRRLKCMRDGDDNFLSSFMFGFVPYRRADFLKEGKIVPFDKGDCFSDCLDDIRKAGKIFGKLGKDCIIVDFTDPKIGFPVVEVVVPGYSDVLPYHPSWSEVLFKKWTRDDVLKSYE